MTTPRLASMVAVLRPQFSKDGPDFALLLVRRSRSASFMANAYVFPGGRIDDADFSSAPEDPFRHAAARELAEEAGLSVNDPQRLVRFAHWITPSVEPKRFDAVCFLVSIDATHAAHGDVKVDGKEVFDPLWLTPTEALQRYLSGELNLPPPTVCTIEEMCAERRHALDQLVEQESSFLSHVDAPSRLISMILARCENRRPHALLPKLVSAQSGQGIEIVLPWDPEFLSLPGEGSPFSGMGEGGLNPPQRICRCILAFENGGAHADEAYAVKTPGTSTVRWRVKRLPS